MKDVENMTYRACFDEVRTFGIEIEGYGLSRMEVVEALQAHKLDAYCCEGSAGKDYKKWMVGTDGTIPHVYPIEVISPILSGKKGIEAVLTVCKALNRIELKTDEHCGLHVHWHVSDYTGRSVINLLRLYAKYEKILDYFFKKERRGDWNIQCHSLIKNGSIDWIQGLQKEGMYQAYQIAREFELTQPVKGATSSPSARHHKVNPCAINKYGTIEFRQHHGTLDFEEIYRWTIFSQQLVSRAKEGWIGDGVATWESLIKTLALTDTQLDWPLYAPDKKILEDTREFYRKIYRKNKDECLCHL